ncbi:MAG: general stress protein [Chloroflexota bacterium]|nr:general stress protein [Chloroflexota bacterium]
MATINEHSTLIAIFANHEQANQCIDTLRHSGHNLDQLRLVERGTNSFVENFKNLFTGQPTATTNSVDDWTRIGVPEQDAHNYQRELDAGRSIVLVKSASSPEQALGILRQSGAYDIAFRWRTAPPALAQETYNADAHPRNP